jgi:hypothetical protein
LQTLTIDRELKLALGNQSDIIVEQQAEEEVTPGVNQ